MQDFDSLNNPKENISDIKSYIFRILANWKWFLVTIPIALIIAFYINLSTQRKYNINSTIAIKEMQNPLFSSSTNIAFNWGGVSDKVESIRRVISSRSHNEQVVSELEFYTKYLREGRFRIEDAYGETPYIVRLEPNKFQLLERLIRIDFIDNQKFKLSIDFEDSKTEKIVNYDRDLIYKHDVVNSLISQEFELDKPINLPFLNLTLESLDGFGNIAGKSFILKFKSLNNSVKQYSKVIATPIDNSSLLSVTSVGSNKKRLVDYINKSIELLIKNQLELKTNYASQTLDFIDEQFNNTRDSLQLIEDDIGKYKEAKDIYNLSAEGSQIFSQTISLDKAQVSYLERLEYYENLESYINTSQSYSNIPAPAVINIEDATISPKITTLTQLSTQKEKLQTEVTDNHPTLITLNQEIESAKNVLLENISSLKNVIELSLKNSKRRLNNYNYQLRKLPVKEQNLLAYQRKYAMTESNYKYLLQKRYEADIAIAASVSDITVLDKAKDTGQISTEPRTSFNYVIALLLSIILPLFILIALELIDTKVHTVEDIESLTTIPILGVVGRSIAKNNLAVFLKPKSVVAEAFRALRSNLFFLFDRNKIGQSKTILVTSSISGEGKTFVSINLSTVFALSDKKTIIVGLDLRKPKIFNDFDLKNDFGVVNFLIGNMSINEIIQKTHIDNLDFISAGPIPPNPSELLLGIATKELIEHLKHEYDYIILDTPPVGLVSDALELLKYADATLYIVRQKFTDKGMLKIINDRYLKQKFSKLTIVLNNFKSKSNYGYGYGYGANYGYQEEVKQPFYKRIFKKK
jgi:capsular exopolysaccharide synthesis family protein